MAVFVCAFKKFFFFLKLKFKAKHKNKLNKIKETMLERKKNKENSPTCIVLNITTYKNLCHSP